MHYLLPNDLHVSHTPFLGNPEHTSSFDFSARPWILLRMAHFRKYPSSTTNHNFPFPKSAHFPNFNIRNLPKYLPQLRPPNHSLNPLKISPKLSPKIHSEFKLANSFTFLEIPKQKRGKYTSPDRSRKSNDVSSFPWKLSWTDVSTTTAKKSSSSLPAVKNGAILRSRGKGTGRILTTRWVRESELGFSERERERVEGLGRCKVWSCEDDYRELWVNELGCNVCQSWGWVGILSFKIKNYMKKFTVGTIVQILKFTE